MNPDLKSLSVQESIIAFDENCAKCKRISAQIQKITDGLITALPLDDPTVINYRERIYGQNVPPGPTLIKLRGALVQCWSGPRMFQALVQEVGFYKSVELLKILGLERRTKGLHSPTERIAKSTTRRGMFQIAAGVVAGVSLAFGGTVASANSSTLAKFSRSLKIASPRKAEQILEKIVASQDLSNVIDASWIVKLNRAKVEYVKRADKEFFFLKTSEKGRSVFDDVHLNGAGFLARMSIGESVTKDSELISCVICLDPDNGDYVTYQELGGEVSAEFFSLKPTGAIDSLSDQVDPGVDEVVQSFNGDLTEPAPDGSIEASSGRAAQDPCGACGSPRKMVNYVCKKKAVLDCVLEGASCAACATSCASAVTSALCVTCIFGACRPAGDACCSKVVKGAKSCKTCPND